MRDDETTTGPGRAVLPAPDPHGQAALMLCEGIVHLLVEHGAIGRQQMIDAIEGIIDVMRQMGGGGAPAVGAASVVLLEDIANSARAMPFDRSPPEGR